VFDMNILVTSARMPFALDEIRKLGERGHRVDVADTFRTAPGFGSKWAAETFVVPSPRYETQAFLDECERIIAERSIALVLPTFEEALFMRREPDRLSKAEIFAPDFSTLSRLHDKARFLELARALDLRVPETRVVNTREELKRATEAIDPFFARPTHSRGGLELFTNQGPLTGALTLDDCDPTASNPWLVQSFVEGVDKCCFSVVHQGKIAAHAAYVHPREIDHAGGIVFRSIDPEPTYEVSARIAAELGYTGQMSLDFLDDGEGLVAVECNPRATAGVVVMDGDDFEEALRDRHPVAPRLTPAGVERKYTSALLRDMFVNPAEARESASYLLADIPDVYTRPDDPWPGVLQVLSYSHTLAYLLQRGRGSNDRSALMASYFDDIAYDEDPTVRR
jgi:predicted ATP-grasp superfamily ATP-dependent carboligase